MSKTILANFKDTICDYSVDVRFYKEDNNLFSFAINPELRDAAQATFHSSGETFMDNDLEGLLFKYESCFKKEFQKVEEVRENFNF